MDCDVIRRFDDVILVTLDFLSEVALPDKLYQIKQVYICKICLCLEVADSKQIGSGLFLSVKLLEAG